jgi:hypothetical protein
MEIIESDRETLACPRCDTVASLKVTKETPTSRGFALCTAPNCASRIELDEFDSEILPRLTPTPSSDSAFGLDRETMAAQIDFLVQAHQHTEKRLNQMDGLMVKLQEVTTELQQTRKDLEQALQHTRSLTNENAVLKNQLRVLLKGKKVTPATTANAAPAPTPTATNATTPTPTTPAPSSWAERTGAYLPPVNLQRTARRVAAACRPFQPVTGPQGFEYLWITRNRPISRPDIRRRFRQLGIETTRVIDIMFPTRTVTGILVHLQYKEAVKEVFKAYKIALVEAFDPTDPIHISDPKHAQLSTDDRFELAMELQLSRCVHVLERLAPHTRNAVARYFIEAGWMTAEDVPANPTPNKYMDRDAPAAGFGRVEETMSETMSDTVADSDLDL